VNDRMKKAARSGRERAEVAKARAADRAEAARARASAAREAGIERIDAARAAAGEFQAQLKPRLRGVIHSYAFPVSLLAGLLLVLLIGDTAVERIALGIYALSLSALLGTSAIYHRVNWQRPRARLWMRRLDHSMIFLLIAGTITPFAVLVLDGAYSAAVLITVWTAALAGIVVETIWVEAPKWVSATVYVSVGLLGALAMPAILAEAGIGAGLLIAFGGVLYIAGAVIYARQRPNPRPATFGYHEIFHVLVVAAAAAHFVAVALYAGPGG
jgi:hemolysin III